MIHGEISGSHGGEYEDDCLLGVLLMEAVNTSETSVNFYESSWRSVPENSRPHIAFMFDK
jgi:hypothetical protein